MSKEKLIGGEADFLPDEVFDLDSLLAGSEEDLEHTDDPETAKEIAKDHLVDDPDYYVREFVSEVIKRCLS